MAVPLTPSLLVAPPPTLADNVEGGGGGYGPEQNPHGTKMPTGGICRRIDFPRGESGGGNDNNVAAAAASADADTADSGNCGICEGG